MQYTVYLCRSKFFHLDREFRFSFLKNRSVILIKHTLGYKLISAVGVLKMHLSSVNVFREKSLINKKILISVLLLIVLALILSSCTSPQERNGVSLLPHNRPASWEAQRSTGMQLF